MIISLDIFVAGVAAAIVAASIYTGERRTAAAIGMAVLVLTVGWLVSGTPDLSGGASWGL